MLWTKESSLSSGRVKFHIIDKLLIGTYGQEWVNLYLPIVHRWSANLWIVELMGPKYLL